MRWLRRGTKIERQLRRERPEPSRRLVRAIASDVSRQPRRRTVRGLARVGVLSAALAVGLLAVGGLGFAMSSASDFIVKITSSKLVIKDAPRTVVANAANDQYGTTTSGPPSAPSTTTETFTTTTTTEETPPGGGETAAVAQPGTSGSIESTEPGSNEAVVVAWDPDTFAGTAAIVNLDPTPPVTEARILGQNNQIVGITIDDAATGQPVHALNAPLDVLFVNAPPGFVPSISTDGKEFRALTQIAGPPLPAGMQDAYYVDSKGTHVLTRHVTLFAMLYRANVTVSESGRKTATPGSGRFGDPTRIHVGPPALRFTQNPSASGRDVNFTFFVDEQAAVWFHVVSGGKQQRIVVSKSAIRKHRLGGVNRKSLHVAVLRPGTISVRLRVNGSADSVVVTAIDFDGHKVSQTAKVQ